LSVGGISCAGCIAKIERRLETDKAVRRARVNFTSKRLTLEWVGGQPVGDRLVAAVRALGFTVDPVMDAPQTADTSREASLLKALAVAGFGMGNVMLISVMLWTTDAGALGTGTTAFFHWISALIGLPVILYSGRHFALSAYRALRHGRTNMDVPITLALILASALSIVEISAGGQHVYFDSAVMLTFFLLIGRYLDARALGRARSSAAALLQHFSGVTQRIGSDGRTEAVPIRDLARGDQVQLSAGSAAPTDLRLASGMLTVDPSMVTGESLPVRVQPGAEIAAGMIVLEGSGTAVVSKPADSSSLAEIARLIQTAEQSHARYVRLADRAASIYTPLVHSLAAAAFLLWWLGLGAGWQDALITSVSVLIITCPCALGLAVPVVQVLTSSWLYRRGILLKSGDALERLAAIRFIAFDKTGTLTEGRPVLKTGEEKTGQWSGEDLQLAAALGRHSRHPLCRAVVQAADDVGQDASQNPTLHLDSLTETAGMGLRAVVDGVTVMLGSRVYVGVTSDELAANMRGRSAGTAQDCHCEDPGQETEDRDGLLEMWLRRGSEAAIRFSFSDRLRSDASQVCAGLAARNIPSVIMSGDRLAAVQSVAEKAGISRIWAGLKPQDKVTVFEDLRADLGKGAMVGDGLNDAAILSHADISLAPATALDISQKSADIVFQGRMLASVLDAYLAAKVSKRLVLQNFALAVIYNCIAIPAAFAGYVTPAVAALAMSGSSLLVIANAFRLDLLIKRDAQAPLHTVSGIMSGKD